MASNAAKGALSGAGSGAISGGMVAGPWGALAGGIMGGISGLLGGGAADDAEKLAEAQAEFVQMETRENVRRMRQQAEYVVGEAKAAVGASDLMLSGSSLKQVNALRSSWSNDIAWKQFSGKKEAEMIMEGGRNASSGLMTSLFTQQVGSVLGAGASFAAGGGFSSAQKTNLIGSSSLSSPSSPHYAPISLAR